MKRGATTTHASWNAHLVRRAGAELGTATHGGHYQCQNTHFRHLGEIVTEIAAKPVVVGGNGVAQPQPGH